MNFSHQDPSPENYSGVYILQNNMAGEKTGSKKYKLEKITVNGMDWGKNIPYFFPTFQNFIKKGARNASKHLKGQKFAGEPNETDQDGSGSATLELVQYFYIDKGGERFFFCEQQGLKLIFSELQRKIKFIKKQRRHKNNSVIRIRFIRIWIRI